jgi:integrase
MPASITPLHAVEPAPRTAGGNNTGTRRQFGNVRKLPSKRWQASYLGPDGVRHNAPTTFDTKGDALAWLSLRQAEITEHRWRPPAPGGTVLTVGEYATGWLAARELKPRTRYDYQRLLDRLILPTFGDRPLSVVTPTAVRQWYTKLDPATPTLRSHAYALLRTLFATAITDELLNTANPCRIRGAGSAKRAREIRPASVEELATLIGAAPPKYRAMLILGAWCALRFGELTELRRKDVDLKAGVIRVRRGVTWVNGEPIIGTPKSAAGSRNVSIPPHLVGVLRDHLHDHAQPGRDGLLFHSQDGGHLAYSTMTKMFYRARRVAGRDDLTLHQLRHTGAVLAAEAGATLAELMERLGHGSPQMAIRYQHVARGRAAEIAARMSQMVEPG